MTLEFESHLDYPRLPRNRITGTVGAAPSLWEGVFKLLRSLRFAYVDWEFIGSDLLREGSFWVKVSVVCI